MQKHIIIEQTVLTNRKDVEEAKKTLENAIIKNDTLFLNAIKEQDNITIGNAYDWGLSWESSLFWRKTFNALQYLSLTNETIDQLMLFNPTEIIDFDSYHNTTYYKKDLTPAKNWKKLLEDCITSNLYHNDFNINLFIWAKDNIPDYFIIPNNVKHIIQHFCQLEDVSDPQYQPFHHFLLHQTKLNIGEIFHYVTQPKSMEYFVNSVEYKPFLHTFLEDNDNKEKKEFIMNEAIKSGNLAQIKFWHEHGVPLPTDHHPYTNLFASKLKLDAAKYVCQHLTDITIKNQCILKSALHHNVHDIIPDILKRYTHEEMEQLPLAIINREPSLGTKYVKEYIIYFNHQNFNKILKNDSKKTFLKKNI